MSRKRSSIMILVSYLSLFRLQKEMLNQWLFTSNTDLRATPQDFYDQLNEEFGFTLDPCATHENHKCDKYYTKEQDGLVQSRDNEIVYCNPPYWREIKKRVQKWAFARGGVVVMLLPARTDTSRFHDYIYHKSEIRFIRGRLKFWDSKNSAPFPSMVVVFR